MALLRNPTIGDDPDDDALDADRPCDACGDERCRGECQSAHPRDNRFAREGRARKVEKLLAVMPRSKTEDQRALLLRALGAFSREGRQWIAKEAGVREPSDLTWEALLDAVRVRPLAKHDRRWLSGEIRNIAQVVATCETEEERTIATERLVELAQGIERMEIVW